MKFISTASSLLLVMVCLAGAHGQPDTVYYKSEGHFEGLNLTDSMMIKGNFEITIAPKEVEIIKVNAQDSSKNEVFLKRRTMSAIKYRAIDGGEYYVWKLGDRKMVLRTLTGTRYLSVYQADEFGLPGEYITFKLVD